MADTFHHLICQIVISTGVVISVAGTSNSGNRDGSGINVVFSYPIGITIDGTKLYLTEHGNNNIRMIVK